MKDQFFTAPNPVSCRDVYFLKVTKLEQTMCLEMTCLNVFTVALMQFLFYPLFAITDRLMYNTLTAQANQPSVPRTMHGG